MPAKRYLEEYGILVARNGYEVIPIIPGEKRPYGKKWQTYDGSEEGVSDWLKAGKGDHGIGIKSRHTPAVDIDVLDPAVVKEIREMVFAILGEGMQRIGLPPKELLVYQTDEPFPKVDTGFWLDNKGRTVKVEILGDGQQFVAAHIHPDTGKPYQWLNGRSVLKTPRDDLPIIRQDHAKAIREAAIEIFLGHGWTKKPGNVTRMDASGYDPDDPFAAVRQKTDISDSKLFDRLMLVPSSEEYDMWFHVGMALYHQYDGEQYGLDLWHQWSATADNYDAEALDKKWPTFKIEGKDRPPITARFILARAKEVETETNEKTLAEVLEGVREARDLPALETVCEKIRTTQFSVVVREMLIGKVKDRFKDITGIPPRIGVVREMTRYESKENQAMPGWLKNWVYCQHDKSFFNTADRRMIDKASFDDSHARLLLTPEDRLQGKSVPETSPSAAALNLYQIPVVYLRQYWPGMDRLYRINGTPYVNSYTDEGIPEPPGEMTSPEREAIQMIEDHFKHLFANERDRSMLLDFITYIVQNPGQRINWAILIQGAEGDGKSFFSLLLQAVIGENNVNIVPGSVLEEKYNPWAEDAQVCFVEDVRLHGNNRFDAINKLKPMITNTTVSIRRMNTNLYKVLNTMNYITTANIKDALPVGDDDSRFFPLFTRFQSQTAIRSFKKAYPDYYKRLHGALEFAGAIRKWLLERQLGPEFDPKERAPVSSYKAEMIEMNRSDEEQALLDCLEESDRKDFSSILLDSGLIVEQFMDKDALPPQTKALKRLLSTQGFSFLGRYKIGGEKRRFWSQRPEIWSEDEERRGDEIRDFLDPEGL
mgnify:CR=1 FL=1